MLYIHIAKLLKNGDWKGVYEKGFYSLYPFAILGFQKIFTNWETAGRMASVFFGSFTMLPLFFLFRKMFDLKITVVACIFFVLSPRIAQYSSDVLREPLFWMLSVSALWSGWKAISEKRWTYAVVSSFFTGLASFTRMEGVGLILILCLWSVWFLLYLEHNVKRFLMFLVLFFVSFPLIFTIPLYSLKLRTGKWEMGHVVSKIPMMITNNSKAHDQSADNEQAATTWSGFGLVNTYTFFAWEAFYKFFRSFHVAFILLLFFGIFRRRAVGYSSNEVPALIWLSVFLIIALLYAYKASYISTRHGLLMGIPALLWVSIGFFELNARLSAFFQNRHWYRYLPHLTAYLLVIICLTVLPKTLLSSVHDKIEMKKAGIYLKNTGYAREKFVVEPRIKRLIFYADSPYIEIPVPSDYRVFNEFLKEQDAVYLIVDERSIDGSVKGFREHAGWLNLEKVGVPEFEKYKDYSFVLYRIKR